jgi:hypothetical protein
LLRAYATAEFGDILLSHGADGDPLAIWPILIGTTEHIEPVALAASYSYGYSEPRPGELGAANGMAVLQLYRVYLSRHVYPPGATVVSG